MAYTRLVALLGAFVCLILANTLVLPAGWCQSTSATLGGSVRDAQNAVVPHAEVSLTNLETSERFVFETTTAGEFRFRGLKPSRYELVVQAAGFSQAKLPLVLNVGDARVAEVRLRVGTAKESITVESTTSVATEDSSVSTVIDRQFVGSLPLNGRSFSTLIPLAPGVTLLKTNFGNQGQFSINGQRGDANYLTIDGVSANIGISSNAYEQGQGGSGSIFGAAVTGGLNNLASVDDVQEFRLETSSFAAEFGRTPGGQVQIETRSGTKDLHGSAFDYLRNDVFDARDWFLPAGQASPKLRQNDFGGVLGGPVVLPRAYDGRRRTFFFFSYEGLRLQQPNTGITLTPSLAARAATPAALQPIIDAYPLPNGMDNGDGTAQYLANFSNKTILDSTSLRFDHNLSQRISFFVRAAYAPSNKQEYGGTNNTGDYASGNAISALQNTAANARTVTVGSTQTLSSHLVNEARANYSAVPVRVNFDLVPIGGAQVPASADVLPSFASPQQDGFIYSVQSLPSLRYGRGLRGAQRQVNVVDNLSWSFGAHALKFGFDYRRLSPHTEPPRYQQELYQSGIGTLGAQQQDPGTLLSGLISSVEIDSFSPATLLFRNWSLYGQDTWRVNQRLSLNYGLRWDVNPAPRAANGPPLLAVTGTGSPATLAPAPTGTPIYTTRYGNVAPRFGLVFAAHQAPGRETMIRVGGGIYYDLGYGLLAASTAGYPYYRTNFYNDAPYPLPSSIGHIIQPSDPNPLTGFFANPNLETARTYEWNVALEQALGASQSLSLNYVGAAGRRLLRTEYYPNPNPLFIYPLISFNGATSDYHALQVQFKRSLRNGLQVLASYTWAHSIDIVSDDSDGLFNSQSSSGYDINRDRASSDFDVRHTFTAAFTYELPRVRSLGAVGSALLDGWALRGNVTARTANPFDLIGGYVNEPSYSSVRPDVVPGLPFYLSDSSAPGGRRLNPAAFALVPTDPNGNALRQGTLGRNTVRAFPVNQVDLSLRRTFPLREAFALDFSVDAFNLVNHPNFGTPNNDLTSDLFGRATAMFGRDLGGGSSAGGYNTLYQIGGPRSLQLALKLKF